MRKNKAFTLIELLIVIAIIGILASVILVSLSNSRDKAKQKSAYATLRSMQAALVDCIMQNKVLYCTGNEDNHLSSNDCGGGAWAIPRKGTSSCGNVDTNNGDLSYDWPDVSMNEYRYSAFVGSQYINGRFAVSIYPDFDGDGVPGETETIFCCTQNGCREMNSARVAQNGGQVGSECRTEAGFVGADD